MSYYAPDPANPQRRPSGWKAIVRVLYEPTKVFQEFEDRVPIFPGYAAQMLLTLVGFLLILPITLRTIEQTSLSNPMYTPELVMVSKISGAVVGGLMAMATPWLAGLVTSLIAMFFGQFQEVRPGFGSYLGMLGYARMPLIIGSLVGSVLTWAMGDMTRPISMSLAVLAPEGAPAMLTGLLGTLNPFTAWYYFVLATGFGALHKGTAAKGAGLVLVLYALTLVFAIAGAALTNSLMGLVPQM